MERRLGPREEETGFRVHLEVVLTLYVLVQCGYDKLI